MSVFPVDIARGEYKDPHNHWIITSIDNSNVPYNRPIYRNSLRMFMSQYHTDFLASSLLGRYYRYSKTVKMLHFLKIENV